MRGVLTLLFFVFSFFVFSQSEIDPKSVCGSCNLLPGQVDKFAEALKESKLHYYTDQGTNKLDLKKANEECNINYFSICYDMLVLTSTGQKKDRTEIRQKKKLTLNDYSEMVFEAAIFDTPKDNPKKGVTIAQIHSSAEGVKRPLLRVEVAGGKEIRSIFTDTYIKGEGKSENDFLVPFDDGDLILCSLVIEEADDKVAVSVYNKTKDKRATKQYSAGELWKQKDGEFYFKAGAYTQVSGPKTAVFYNNFHYKY